MSLVAGRHDIGQCNARRRFAKFHYLGKGAINCSLTPIGFGHDTGDWPAVARDDKRFAALDLVEKARQMRLGFGGLDYAHRRAPINWLI
jgi:hypothetical protein